MNKEFVKIWMGSSELTGILGNFEMFSRSDNFTVMHVKAVELF